MAGAYVAKVADESSLDVPPGWGDWSFPGPNPPGYTPDYGIALTVPQYVVPGTQVTGITGKLTDHEDYGTIEPTGSQVWSATLKSTGATVQLKEEPAGGYADSVTKDYSDLGDDFWGNEPSFYFNIGVEHVGDSVVLLVSDGDVFGNAVETEGEIPIAAEVALSPISSIVVALELTGHSIGKPSNPKFRIKVSRTPSPEQVDWPQFGAVKYGDADPSWWSDDSTYDDISEFTCTATYTTITATCNSPVEGKVYWITLDANEGGNATVSVTFSATITRDDGSKEEAEQSFTIEPYGSNEAAYVYVNVDSRDVSFSGWG